MCQSMQGHTFSKIFNWAVKSWVIPFLLPFEGESFDERLGPKLDPFRFK